MNHESLLSDKNIVIISVPLAEALGIVKSAILRNIKYWISHNQEDAKDKLDTHFHHDMWWMYDTYEQWSKRLRLFSERSIRRNIKELENLNLIFSGNFNGKKYDQTKWYTINIPAFNAFMELWEEHGCPMKHDTKKTPEYGAFIKEWEAISGNYRLASMDSGTDVPTVHDGHMDESTMDTSGVSTKATPIPEVTTEDTTGKRCTSPDKSPDMPPNSRLGNKDSFGSLSGNTKPSEIEDEGSESKDEYDIDESALPQLVLYIIAQSGKKWKNWSKSRSLFKRRQLSNRIVVGIGSIRLKKTRTSFLNRYEKFVILINRHPVVMNKESIQSVLMK